MLIDWQQIAADLHSAIKLGRYCRCEYARDGRGVPIWEGIPLARKLLTRCSACAAVARYEEALKQGD